MRVFKKKTNLARHGSPIYLYYMRAWTRTCLQQVSSSRWSTHEELAHELQGLMAGRKGSVRRSGVFYNTPHTTLESLEKLPNPTKTAFHYGHFFANTAWAVVDLDSCLHMVCKGWSVAHMTRIWYTNNTESLVVDGVVLVRPKFNHNRQTPASIRI